MNNINIMVSLYRIFNNFLKEEIVAICLITLFISTIWFIKYYILKKFDVIDLLLSIFIIVVSMVVNLNKAFVIIMIILDSLVLLYSLYSLSIMLYVNIEKNKKTLDYVKNTEYDFYVQMNAKDKLKDCSKSLLKLTGLAKKEVLNASGWKFIFDSLNVKSINKKEFSLDVVKNFTNEFIQTNSKHKIYKFNIETEIMVNDKPEILLYNAFIQPIYLFNKIIARNVYFYEDKVDVVGKLKNIVRDACTDIEDYNNQIDMLMNLSEGIVMYYDFQNKTYVATECMMQYTATTKKYYSFEEVFNLINPEDVKKYIEQAETVNSISVTKINYRLEIAGIYYQVEEDSIYMRKDYGLVSIIRISDRKVRQSVPQNAKIRDDIEVLNNLSSKNISSKLERTTNILNSVLGDETNEKD